MITKFAHIRSELNPNYGGVTIVYRSESKDAPTVTYAFAECSKKDIYSKAKGRLIASGRLQADRSFTVNVEEHAHGHIMNCILDHIEKNKALTKTSKYAIANAFFEPKDVTEFLRIAKVKK